MLSGSRTHNPLPNIPGENFTIAAFAVNPLTTSKEG